jgi:hypothetical protein
MQVSDFREHPGEEPFPRLRIGHILEKQGWTSSGVFLRFGTASRRSLKLLSLRLR